jgi:hypothetical protein
MQGTEDPNSDLARRVCHGVNSLANPFQGASVAGGEIHELPADGLRIEAGIKCQGKGSGGQTSLEHTEPHAGHHLASQGRVLTTDRSCRGELIGIDCADFLAGPCPR